MSLSSVILLLVGIVIGLGAIRVWDAFWSFRAQSLADYAAPTASAGASSLAEWFGGRFDAHGVIYDFSGRVRSRFTADIEGSFADGGGRLSERFVFAAGNVDHREWTITMDPDGRRFTATAPDVIGVGEGEIAGDAIRMTYRLMLPERAGGHVLDVVDWLYRLDDGAIVNRSEMRKFGVKAAELVAVFRPAAQPAALPAAAE